MRVSAELAKALDPLAFQRKFLDSGIRADGRASFTSSRSINVQTGVISSALSSASCNIGKTSVIVGISAGVFSLPQGIVKSGHEGKIIVNSDFSLCVPERHISQVKGGCLSDRVQTVFNIVLDRKQLEAEIIKSDVLASLLGDAGVTPDQSILQHVWDITISILVVNDEGSVFDAALIASTRALQGVKLPALNEQLRIVHDRAPMSLSLKTIPSPLTVCLYLDSWLVDPTGEEQSLFPSYSIVVNDSGAVIFMIGPDLPEGHSNESSTKSFELVIGELTSLAKSQYSARASLMNS